MSPADDQPAPPVQPPPPAGSSGNPESAVPEPAIPEAELTLHRRLRLSLVWIVPVLALVIGAVLVVRSLLLIGPSITISFRSAEGIEAGKTEVRFKEVVVGRVTKVSLHPDKQQVLVSVQLDKAGRDINVIDTRFWVVRPRIGAAGVSGLSTLLSGAYIAADAGASDQYEREFVGLDTPPLVLRGEPGRSFELRADDLGSLDIGWPVYYRRLRVGRVVGYGLAPKGVGVLVQVFIESPHEYLVTRLTRFWNASGVEVTLNASGLTINTQSVASVIAGGIAFAQPADALPASPAPAGERFKLFASERNAMAPEDGVPLRVRMVFDQSVRGLEPGAPIDLQGIEMGVVRSFMLQPEAAVGPNLPVEVLADLYPQRLGAIRERVVKAGEPADKADRRLIGRLVNRGLRAQLRNGNLVTGRMFVALDFVPKAAPVRFDPAAVVPTLPTVSGSLNDMLAQVSEVVGKLSKVQFDEIGSSLTETLKSATATSNALQKTLAGADTTMRQITPDAQKSLVELQTTLQAAQKTLGTLQRTLGDSDSPLLHQGGQTLSELQRAAQAMRGLAEYLQRHPESLLRGKPTDAPTTTTGGGTK